jgi:hypothetical protein
VKSIVGVTNQDLISTFYGLPTPDKLNPFIATILGMNMTGEMNLMHVLKMLAYRAYHTITEMVAPPMTRGPAGSGGTQLALGRLMMIPRLFSSDPPLCNVFFPQVVSAIDSNVTALKATRLIVQQNNPITNSIPTAAIGISPTGLAEKMITKSGDTTKLSFATAITQEETEVGVLASVVPDVYGAAIFFAKNPGFLADWFAKTGPLRFSSQRSEQQTTVINMEFNPFVALSFPGLVYDPDLGAVRGMVVSVKHTITATGATTQVGMAYCVHEDDALEYQGYPDTDFDSGFGGKLNTYKAGNPSDVYEKILGCRSLFKARADIAKEAASAASAKRIAALNQTTSSQENFDKNNAIEKEESDKAHTGALKADGVSEQARKLYEAITTKSGSMEAEKDAVRQLAIRNIASYEDMQRFYHTFGSISSFEGFTQVTEPPFQLILKLPYASVQQKLKLTDKRSSGTTESEFVVAADVTPKPLQVVDRVGPVLDYATSIEE